MTTAPVHQALVVARMAPGSAEGIARLFADSDGGELPRLVGVRRRSLFQFGDVYMHLIEADRPPGPAIAGVGDHPEFRGLCERLTEFVSPYDPQTWRGPRDAMAHRFYTWERGPA
ncbi:TcmI family type II polyketide cyclase [Streptomyces clavuligerus]|uniref:Cyclase II n=1 Tax=Streptomyces clavuligerus TaxID=1901 RepID=E2PW02_STRCL|nr:TcmI family type II polyketide cyclase [Streptomyces clavuligerus]ANW17507.1 polyketide synthase [Streptomyces clavuligerus]AXU12052.1 TcmI family type II polyketide cyclase [Streptomyces clavuligerus]EFG09992.1 cyclase II [Streptomyces clavuligerus]MBY6301913.1 TcmI family type II polyketide cyclase [Streptomyces clavuligerus]QCS04833.1 TcmI family type II polyketide cyclase [Streptomyces clavuligerus]